MIKQKDQSAQFSDMQNWRKLYRFKYTMIQIKAVFFMYYFEATDSVCLAHQQMHGHNNQIIQSKLLHKNKSDF